MTSSPNNPLLKDSQCRDEMLTGIGSRLRQMYDGQHCDTLPERLQHLLHRLTTSEQRG
jgi:hypothetical protein